MTATTETAVGLPHCDLGSEALLPAQPERLLGGLAGQMHNSALCADQAPPTCPVCQNKLSRWKQGHWTSIQTRFGAIRLQRARGYCKRRRK
ncbi:MAG TPA: hypothetical protein VH595_14905, partial [Verrucomicrobiae bacterium]|nr:hypothetical protein [Verrucomicrobiae bacterium]